MSIFSENKQLNKEHQFYLGIVVLLHFIFMAIVVVFVGLGLRSYIQHAGWTLNSISKFVFAAVMFGYYYHSVHKVTGLFYALDLWEQSLNRRKCDDNLIRAYRNGQKIFKDFVEVEVFDGKIVPKAGGLKLQSSTESSKK
jgi:hypothetical protein